MLKFFKKIKNYIINKLFLYKKGRIKSYYESNMRKRLVNDNFSIVCSNCIGGVIYHRLSKKFLSPTINLWISQPDFIKFVSNLNYYLSQDLEFVKTKYDYPVAKLSDIFVHFNHSDNIEEAKSDWNKRKNRINFDNLFIIMYDRDGITESDFIKLENINCKNKLVITDKDYKNYSYVKKIVPNKTHNMNEQCMDGDKYGIRTFEKNWDYVSWLNCKETENDIKVFKKISSKLKKYN